MSAKSRLREAATAATAPVLAVIFALVVAALLLSATGDPVWSTVRAVVDYGGQGRVQALTINQATTYYLSALAVAVGFRAGLFNIGVDGQYRLATFAAAAIGSAITLPRPLHIALVMMVGAAVGAVWAGIAAVLRATRGVSEVISTIMLNAVATALVAFLLRQVQLQVAGSNNIATRPLPASARLPGLPLVPGSSLEVFGFVVVAVAAGFAYAGLFRRTRLGFDIRTAGASAPAATASGVDVRRVVVASMLLSGAVAGLVGMPQLLGQTYSYSLDFPAGLGFIGIGIALLGRNNAVGMAIGALLFSYLDAAAVILDINGISRELVLIVQGTTVLSVVIAYELVRRYSALVERRRISVDAGVGKAIT